MKRRLSFFILFLGITFFSFGDNLFSENGNLNTINPDRYNKSLTHPKNRIGLLMPFGFGFEYHDMFETTDGDMTDLSFGGGFGLGFFYGHEFNRYFDLSLEIGFKYSGLSMTLNNGDAYFFRGYFSFTPAVIIPLKGGEKMRFKIGAGPDLYFGNKFTYEGSKIPHGDARFDDEFTYENSFGFHLSAFFEWNFSRNWGLNFGMRGYGVSYDFKESGSGYRDIEKGNELYSPSGAGIDFIIGINYHF